MNNEISHCLEPSTSEDPTTSDDNTDYVDSSKLPFQDLLNFHYKQTVWGFQFGKEVLESTLKNMQEKHEETEIVEKTAIDTEIPGNSKDIIERDQKTPHSRRRRVASRSSKKKSGARRKEFESPQKTRRVPLPLMDWADSKEVWLYMVYKEEALLNLRNPNLFEDNTNFIPRMRAILLDWVMEVCEVYHLRRVTYYLSVDYFDRFISIRPDVPKNQLQLVGVTCLFLASKLEEIYPPRLTEFSYVCDGACKPEEILACELLILNSLGWDLNVMTPSDWLNLYMQIHFRAGDVSKQRLHSDINREFFFPQYSGYQFTRASQLIDLFSLDPGFLKFSYSTIAAAAMYFMYGKRAAMKASGLAWAQLQPCAEYMAVFYHVLKDMRDPKLQSCKGDVSVDEQTSTSLESIRHTVKNLIKNENHSLQTHVVNMEFFERSAVIRLEQMGLKVEKTYVKKFNRKIKDESDEKDDEDDEDYNLVAMYELEKLTSDAVALSDEDAIDLGARPTSNADLVMPEEEKALMSLDQILEGIVKCNRKNINVKMDTSREIVNDETNGSE